MFKIDVFVKTIDGEWIVETAEYAREATAKAVENSIRSSLYIQLLQSEIQDYRTMVYDESEYKNAE